MATLGFEQTSHDRRTERRMIDIGIAREQDHVDIVPAERPDLLNRRWQPRIIHIHKGRVISCNLLPFTFEKENKKTFPEYPRISLDLPPRGKNSSRRAHTSDSDKVPANEATEKLRHILFMEERPATASEYLLFRAGN